MNSMSASRITSESVTPSTLARASAGPQMESGTRTDRSGLGNAELLHQRGLGRQRVVPGARVVDQFASRVEDEGFVGVDEHSLPSREVVVPAVVVHDSPAGGAVDGGVLLAGGEVLGHDSTMPAVYTDVDTMSWASTAEAARELGINQRSVLKRIHSGSLTAKKAVGRDGAPAWAVRRDAKFRSALEEHSGVISGDWLTIEQAADEAGLAASTMQAHIRKRGLTTRKRRHRGALRTFVVKDEKWRSFVSRNAPPDAGVVEDIEWLLVCGEIAERIARRVGEIGRAHV